MRTSYVLVAALVCGLGLGCGPKQTAKPPPTVTAKASGDGGVEELTSRKILHRKDLPEMPGKESVVIIAKIPPGGSSGLHTHPGPEIDYVMAGAVRLEKDGEEARMVNTGETFSTQAGKVHDVKNVGTEPATLVVFMIMDKGAPLSTPVTR